MSKFVLSVDAVISLHVEVEAESLEEAMKEAIGAPVMGLCHQCSRGEKGEWCTSGELDADPALADLNYVTKDGVEVPLTKEVKKMWDDA